jgi:two-component system chemotaxis response regulator CheY
MAFKIQYKFQDDAESYYCIVSYEQYRNFCALPIIQECKIIKENQTTTKKNLDEIQYALDMAYKKDTSHIHKLSENSSL